VSIAAEHFHPVDFFMGVLLPGSFGPSILRERLHITTYLMWIWIRASEGVDGHTGYEFPWSPFRLIPFSASASYHDYHHSHNVGNYSSFLTIWDSVFGCNSAYIEYKR
jgi:sterol desaturase/sphingolipid hydroxylase (fatty acid hydroxylase superfamily)